MAPRFSNTLRPGGCLDGNPVHEESTAIARLAGCDFIVNVVIDEARQILAVTAGDMEAALLEGVDFVRGLVTDTPARAGRHRRHQLRRLSAGRHLLPDGQGHGGGVADRQAGRHDHPGRRHERRDRQPRVPGLFDDNATLEIFMERILDQGYFVMDQWQLEEFAKVHRQGADKGLHRRPAAGDAAADVRRAGFERGGGRGRRPGRVRPDATIAVIPKGPYVLAELAG